MTKRLFGILAAGAFLCAAAAPTTGLAQMDFSGSLHFNAGFPRGDFKDNIERNAYGLDGQIFYSPETSPFAVGLELAYMNYGNESRREPFSTTIPDVTVNVETSNNIVQGFLVLRGGAKSGPIRPYADMLIGLNYLFTETKITDSSHPDDEIASSVNRDDAAFAYGLGGGVMVPVHTSRKQGQAPFQIALDGGLRYIKGNEAQYLKKGSIRRENGRVEFDEERSRTDMLKMHLGVLIRFGGSGP